MTLAKAQAVTSAIIGAGYNASAHIRADGEWVVRASTSSFVIDASAAANLAAAQQVSGKIAEAEFI